MSLRSLLFVPGDSEKKLARSESYGAGVVGIDGKMYDIPHLRQAEHVLLRAVGFAQRQAPRA